MAYTTIDNPELHFQTKTYSGTGNSHAITLDGSENMQPDWVWFKRRDGSANHHAYTSITGVTGALVPNDTDVETTGGLEATNYFSSFDSDGFTLGSGNYNNSNKSGQTYVSWNWKAGGSSTSSNSNGSITSNVSVNSTAGFSTVLWTHDGGNSTIGHGLGAIPQVVITKERNAVGSWNSYFSGIGNAHRIVLQGTNAKISSSLWNSTTPTANVFSMNDSITSNMIAYCFTEKKGYSKFGTYIGNGSQTGPFIYTGFKPAWVVTKRIDATSSWGMNDNKRPGYNLTKEYIILDRSQGEATDGSWGMDLLSNGWKARYDNSNFNASSGEYIYMAFAESPFVNSEGIPNNAR